MRIKAIQWALSAAVLAMSASAFSAPPTPAMLSNACAGCHGTHGEQRRAEHAEPWRPQSKSHCRVAMKGFKSGERPSTVMGRLAKGYSDAEFEAMGEFFSKQKPFTTSQTLDRAKVAKGAELHENRTAPAATSRTARRSRTTRRSWPASG
jgi:sulfide dehydrogenase cytochrome subunit